MAVHNKITEPSHHKNFAYYCQMKECSKFPVPTVFQNRVIDASHPDYNIFFNMLQNHPINKIVHTFYPSLSEEYIY